MDKPRTETEIQADLAISRIRAEVLPRPDWKGATAAVITNLIPFAGGAIAAALGEYASQQRTERICSCLLAINDALERHHTDPEKHLTKDQIVETVNSIVQESVTASDQEKLQLLKNGLGYAFVSADPFEDKQLILTILRQLTTYEIQLLRRLYLGGDPYRIEIGGPPKLGDPLTGIDLIGGNWKNEGQDSSTHGIPLIEFLAQQSSAKSHWVKTAGHLLDSKQLSTVIPHLDENQKVRYQWISGAILPASHLISYVSNDTPVSASRTDFGSRFVKAVFNQI